jgi:putative ABC transport system substrate-binding protein
VNPTTPRSELVFRQMEESAGALGLRLRVLKASTQGELDSVFASLARLRVGALLVAQEPSYLRWREQITALAARHAGYRRCERRALPGACIAHPFYDTKRGKR